LAAGNAPEEVQKNLIFAIKNRAKKNNIANNISNKYAGFYSNKKGKL
jgi:hypothetical protein